MKTLFICLIVGLLSVNAFANGTCKAQFIQEVKKFTGDDGWKFVSVTIKQNSEGQISSISVENQPGATPMFTNNYIFTVDAASVRVPPQSSKLTQTKVIQVDFRSQNRVLELEADGMLMQFSERADGRLYFSAVMKNSNMKLSETLLFRR